MIEKFISQKKHVQSFSLYCICFHRYRDDFFENQIFSRSPSRCPIFPGIARRLYWPFPDPQKATGTEDEKLENIRSIRDQIREHIKSWVKSL
jgi:protein-tyrosine-phosphatase